MSSAVVGLSAPAAFAAKPVPAKVVLTGHVASVVAKRQPHGAPLGSVSVTGKVTPVRAGRVVLQRKVSKAWKDVGRAGLTRKATFTVRGTALPVGRLVLRAVEVGATTVVGDSFSLLVRAPVVASPPDLPPAIPSPTTDTPVAPPSPPVVADPVNEAPLFPMNVTPTPAYDPAAPHRLQLGAGADLGGYVGQEFAGSVTFASEPHYWDPVTFTPLTAFPPGLTLLSDGRIQGRPSVAGSWTIRVKAAGDGEVAEAAYPLIVVAPPTITTTVMAAARVGVPYRQVLTVAGGYAPFVWDVVQRDLPAGLAATPAGVISGVPSAHAVRSVLAVVTDGGQQYGESSENPASASKQLALTVGPLPGVSRTIQVPADEGTVQAAIDAADDGDTVLVAPGRYTGGIDFKGKAITVRSASGAASTVLDAQAPSNALVDTPTVTMDTGESRSAVLQGFTVTGGFADEGGGVAISWSSPTLEDDVFEGNGAWAYGGGVDVFYGAPLLVGNTFGDNLVGTGIPFGSSLAFQGAVGAEASGNTFNGAPHVQTAGMVAILGYGVTFSHNTLTFPWAESAEALSIHSWNVGSSVRVPNVLEDNVFQGGSIVFDFAAVDFVGNTVVAGGQLSWGLQLTDIGHDTVLADNVIVAYGSLIAALTCDGFQAFLGYPDELPTLIDNRVWNAGDIGDPNFPTPAYDSCYGAFNAGAGDTKGDPGFTAYQAEYFLTTAPDYLPRPGSPLIGTGTTDVPGLIALSATDVAGNPRVVGTVDIGAYERQ